MAGRGKARGGRTGARRGRLNSKDGTGSGKQPGDIREEAPCQLCNKIYGEDDTLMQCEDCLLWSCIECLEITAEQYAFMMDNDHVKWYCSDCISNSRAKSKTTNDNLMTMMETIRDSLSGLKLQIEKKADKSVVEDLSLVVDNLEARVSTLEKNDPFPPLPAQPQAPAEVQREVVAQAASELKEHNERKRNSIVFNVPESPSNLKTVCKKDDLEMILGLCERCDQFESDEIVDVKRLGRKTQGEIRPVVVTFKEEQSKARLMTSLYNLRDADAPYKTMRVQHDLTPAEREQEKKLVQEARELTLNEQENFFYVVRGLPGNRKIVRVQKRVRPRDAKGEPKQQETSQMTIVGQGEATAEREGDK